MKITIYELLGLVKDGKAPKKIKYYGRIFQLEEENREISIHKGLFNVDEELDTIYDLLKADLVVKEEE